MDYDYLKYKKILIVDDEADLREMVSHFVYSLSVQYVITYIFLFNNLGFVYLTNSNFPIL